MTGIVTNESAFLQMQECDNYVRFDSEQCREMGLQSHQSYCGAAPYPHIAIENFVPLHVLRRIVDEFPQAEPGRFADDYSKLKTGYQLEKIKSPYTNAVINAFNSAPFLEFLEKMTGITGLVPDPHQVGGGLHETRRGGHLSIHADFNMHPSLHLRRRLNLILFLNENWQDSYGGSLEIWSKDMKKCEKSVLPAIGTAVIFNTDSDSFHGHPDPLTCPDTVTRRSLALYYYAADPDLISPQQARTTNFQKRPASADSVNYKYKLGGLIKDLCPPMLFRAVERLKH